MSERITVFAMTTKGYRVLRAIAAEHVEIVDRVYGSRDRSMTEDSYEAIRSLCADVGWPFEDRTENPIVPTRYSLAVSWKWMLDLPSSRLIVLHDSLLPRYRGFAPLVSALINGDREIGVTALFAGDEYDTGPIIGQAARSIDYPIRQRDAIELVSEAYEELTISIVERLVRGEELVASEQRASAATYSLWRDSQDYRIDWSQPSDRIRRFVDAVGEPYLGAAAIVDGTAARVLVAHEEPDVVIENRVPGKVIFVRDGRPIVACGSGLLRISALVNDETGASMLPLARFRTRFT